MKASFTTIVLLPVPLRPTVCQSSTISMSERGIRNQRMSPGHSPAAAVQRRREPGAVVDAAGEEALARPAVTALDALRRALDVHDGGNQRVRVAEDLVLDVLRVLADQPHVRAPQRVDPARGAAALRQRRRHFDQRIEVQLRLRRSASAPRGRSGRCPAGRARSRPAGGAAALPSPRARAAAAPAHARSPALLPASHSRAAPSWSRAA